MCRWWTGREGRKEQILKCRCPRFRRHRSTRTKRESRSDQGILEIDSLLRVLEECSVVPCCCRAVPGKPVSLIDVCRTRNGNKERPARGLIRKDDHRRAGNFIFFVTKAGRRLGVRRGQTRDLILTRPDQRARKMLPSPQLDTHESGQKDGDFDTLNPLPRHSTIPSTQTAKERAVKYRLTLMEVERRVEATSLPSSSSNTSLDSG